MRATEFISEMTTSGAIATVVGGNNTTISRYGNPSIYATKPKKKAKKKAKTYENEL